MGKIKELLAWNFTVDALTREKIFYEFDRIIGTACIANTIGVDNGGNGFEKT
jgi:hypothetical protein